MTSLYEMAGGEYMIKLKGKTFFIHGWLIAIIEIGKTHGF